MFTVAETKIHEVWPGQPLVVSTKLPFMHGDEAGALARLVASGLMVKRLTLDVEAGCVLLLHVEDTGDLQADIASTIGRATSAWIAEPLAPPATADLARDAFEAYGESTGGKTWDGKPIPPFDAIRERTPHVAAAWEAAADAVRKRLGR